MPERDIKCYFIVNSDLKMGKGKACGQCAHASAAMTRVLESAKTSAYKQWLHEGETKIVTKASGELIKAILVKYQKKLKCFPIYDAGLTQIDPGSLTVLAFEPLASKHVPNEIVNLKLY